MYSICDVRIKYFWHQSLYFAVTNTISDYEAMISKFMWQKSVRNPNKRKL